MESTGSNNQRRHGKPPPEYRFKTGQSGNPKGRPRKKPPTLPEEIAAKLNETLSLSRDGKRIRLKAKQVAIRNLVEKAAGGDRRALTELIQLAEERVPLPSETPWRVIDFYKGAEGGNWSKLTDEFFDTQDERKAAWRKARREASQSLGALVDRELKRRVSAGRGGKRVRVSMQEVIASRFIKEALAGDVALLRLLQKIMPDKKPGKPPLHVEIKRPDESQAQWLAERWREENELQRSLYEELGQADGAKA